MYPCPIGAPTARTSRTWSTTVTCSDATARATQWDPTPWLSSIIAGLTKSSAGNPDDAARPTATNAGPSRYVL